MALSLLSQHTVFCLDLRKTVLSQLKVGVESILSWFGKLTGLIFVALKTAYTVPF